MIRSPRPMLATLVKQPFSDKNWIYEIKLDGYRILTKVNKGKVSLISRNGNSYTETFAEIVPDLELIKHDVVLDGEVVVLDNNGVSDFEALQRYIDSEDGLLTYFVFDLLFLDGKDLRKKPLLERKKALKKALPKLDSVIYLDHVVGKGEAFFAEAKNAGLEGVIAKQKDSKYLMGERSLDWQKFKATSSAKFTIVGYTKPGGSAVGFGSLVLARKRNGKLTYAGRVGTGFSDENKKDMLKKFIHRKSSPLQDPERLEGMKVYWVKPGLDAEVEYIEETSSGNLRHSSFVKLLP